MSSRTVGEFAQSLRTYLNSAREAPAPTEFSTLVRDLPAWLRDLRGNALDLGVPWVTFGARRALERLVSPNSRVFEFGSGGSTIFFARRALQVVSIEHDPEWFGILQNAVLQYENVELILAEPTPMPAEGADPPGRQYVSTDGRYQGRWFRDYVESIDRYPDSYFDVVLVDGRARVDAFLHAVRTIRPGGVIVLDDSERESYASVASAVKE